MNAQEAFSYVFPDKTSVLSSLRFVCIVSQIKGFWVDVHSVQRLSCHKQDFPREILCRGMSWDEHTRMWAVPRCWAVTENTTFQNWLLFPLVIFTVSPNFFSSFCPVSEHFKTVNIFRATVFLWGRVGLHILHIWDAIVWWALLLGGAPT